MQFLSFLTIAAMAAITSAVPSPVDNALESRQGCPYDSLPFCLSDINSKCTSSGIEICQELGCGGPCPKCWEFCMGKARSECAEMGCTA